MVFGPGRGGTCSRPRSPAWGWGTAIWGKRPPAGSSNRRRGWTMTSPLACLHEISSTASIALDMVKTDRTCASLMCSVIYSLPNDVLAISRSPLLQAPGWISCLHPHLHELCARLSVSIDKCALPSSHPSNGSETLVHPKVLCRRARAFVHIDYFR